MPVLAELVTQLVAEARRSLVAWRFDREESISMSRKLRVADLAELAFALKPALTTHQVPVDRHYSLISDVIFQVACFIDERTGSSLHEEVFGVLETHADDLSGELQPADYLVAELQVTFAKGKPAEMNILKSHLDQPDHLKLNLEMTVGVRGLDEVSADVDVDRRFASLMKRRGGIGVLKFNRAEHLDAPRWVSVPLTRSKFGTFDQSLEGLRRCIVKVVTPWA